MKIEKVVAHPLVMPIAPGEHRTAWGEYSSIGIVVVEIRAAGGLVGWGEGLARKSPRAYAAIIDDLLAPLIVGDDAFAVERHWTKMFRQMSGRSGGVFMEALSAVDIALWDLIGKTVGQPLHRLWGGMGRTRVPAYASSISWNAEDTAKRQIDEALRGGFRLIKVKLGAPADRAISWAKTLRRIVGDQVGLCADANWAYDVADAIRVADALRDLNYVWLEEPLQPEDVEGYRRVAAASPMRLAAGESEHTAMTARDLLASRAIGIFQPDCTRSGGITETKRMIALAHAFNIDYAPHVGGGGAIAAAANLQLAAASANCLSYECMTFPSALRQELAVAPVGDVSNLIDGQLPVPTAPGLGIDIDRGVLARFRADRG